MNSGSLQYARLAVHHAGSGRPRVPGVPNGAGALFALVGAAVDASGTARV